MNRSSVFAALLAVTLFAPSLPLLAAEESEEETKAHKAALDLAGAFSNDGFKLRDGSWSGPLQNGVPKLIQVNLYAGNEYWFSVGATEQAKKISVTVFDETGKPMETEPYSDGATAAAGFSPACLDKTIFSS